MLDKSTKVMHSKVNEHLLKFIFHDVFVVSESFGILEVLQTAPQPPQFSHPEIQPS